MTASIHPYLAVGHKDVPTIIARYLMALGMALGMCLFSIPAHSASNYLEAIDAEGDRLEVQVGKARGEEEKLRKLQQPAAKTSATRTARPAGATDDMRVFESQLRAQLPGSYVLYVKLEAGDKESVYKEYQSAPPGGFGQFLPAVSKIISLSIDKRAAVK